MVARDKSGGWYNAKILARRGDPGAEEVRVHFMGWSRRLDEWVPRATHIRGLEEGLPEAEVQNSFPNHQVGYIEDDMFEVETLLKRRRRADGSSKFLVRWCGYSEEADTWEAAESIHEELVAEFELRLASPSPPGPYCLTQENKLLSAEIADHLVAEWDDDIGRKSAALLRRQQDEFAHRRLFSMSPCPAWVFCALHRRMQHRAEQFNGAHSRTRTAFAPPHVRGCLPRATWQVIWVTSAPRSWL